MALCKLCNQSPIGSSGQVCDSCMKKAQYQVKANIVLEDSSSCEWGIAYLTGGVINMDVAPDEKQLVGYWSKWGNGTIWVGLTEPLVALMDKSTLLQAAIAKRRAENLPLIQSMRPTTTRRPPIAKKGEPEPAPKSDLLSSLQALRAKLRSQA